MTYVFAGAEAETTAPPPDVEIAARASAAELRALERPRTHMEVSGGEGVRKDDVTRRESLPERLEPGRRYRDVRIRRWVAGRLPMVESER